MKEQKLPELRDDTIKLDVGCGNNKRTGHIGIDISAQADVDYIIDISREPLPFTDDSVDSIYTAHCLEHVDNLIYAMNEFWRVLKWGGELKIHVPHWNSSLSVQDPTHERMFSEESFKFFCGGYIVKHKLNYGIKACFKQEAIKVTHTPDDKDGPNDTVYNRMIYAHLIKDDKHADNLRYAFPFNQIKAKSKPDWVEPEFAGHEDKREMAEEMIRVDENELTHLHRFSKHLDGIQGIKVDAISRYGTDAAPLGLKGLFADLNRKHVREKRFLWYGETTSSEHIKDTIYDHVVYLIMTLMAYEDEEGAE